MDVKEGREGTRLRNDSGLNLIELLIAVAIIVLLTVLMAGSLLLRHGLHWWTLSLIPAPVVLIVLLGLANWGIDSLRERRAAAAIERVLHALEGADPERARRAYSSLPVDRWNSLLQGALDLRRQRIVAAVSGSWPGREVAYKLHHRLSSHSLDNLSQPLVDALALWPEDLFLSVLYDISRYRDASEPTRALIARASTGECRRRVLWGLFSSTGAVVPQTPTPEWLDVLRPHRGELELLLGKREDPSPWAVQLRTYLREMT